MNALTLTISDDYDRLHNYLLNNSERINDALIYSINKNNLRIVRLLVNNGADVNVIASDYSTPLLNAVKKQNMHIIEWLLSNGAITTLRELYTAIKLGDIQITKLLLQHSEIKYIDINFEISTEMRSFLEAHFQQINYRRQLGKACQQDVDTEEMKDFMVNKLNMSKEKVDTEFSKGAICNTLEWTIDYGGSGRFDRYYNKTDFSGNYITEFTKVYTLSDASDYGFLTDSAYWFSPIDFTSHISEYGTNKWTNLELDSEVIDDMRKFFMTQTKNYKPLEFNGLDSYYYCDNLKTSTNEDISKLTDIYFYKISKNSYRCYSCSEIAAILNENGYSDYVPGYSKSIKQFDPETLKSMKEFYKKCIKRKKITTDPDIQLENIF